MANQDLSDLPRAPPGVSIRLSDDVTLVVRYHSINPHDFKPTISAPSVDRTYQAELTTQTDQRQAALSAANGGELGSSQKSTTNSPTEMGFRLTFGVINRYLTPV